jgi:hypothetical protein
MRKYSEFMLMVYSIISILVTPICLNNAEKLFQARKYGSLLEFVLRPMSRKEKVNSMNDSGPTISS